MPKIAHPIYYYKIKRNLTFEQVSEELLLKKNKDVIFIVRTTFILIQGETYTYSSHSILDVKLKPTFLKMGNIKVENSYFKEYWKEMHCATISCAVKDSEGVIRIMEYNHSNGNSDGNGIDSIIACLKFMQHLSFIGTWRDYDIIKRYKNYLLAKILIKLGPFSGIPSDLLDEGQESLSQMSHVVWNDGFKEYGLGWSEKTSEKPYLQSIIKNKKKEILLELNK